MQELKEIPPGYIKISRDEARNLPKGSMICFINPSGFIFEGVLETHIDGRLGYEYYVPSNNVQTPPNHYQLTVNGHKLEARDVIRAVTNDYYYGSTLKYLFRAGKKIEPGLTADQSKLKDLKKARDFLNFLIDELEVK